MRSGYDRGGLFVEPLLSVGFTCERFRMFLASVIDIPCTPTASLAVRGTRNGLRVPVLVADGPGPAVLDAGAISGTNEQEKLWGVTVVQTTQQAAGTAAVLSVASGAAVIYVREPWTTMFDPYSQLANNIYQYVGETRIALATPRPQAINLVTGLPIS